MAINGLNKITDKILSEAQAKADKILADAQAECDRINAEYAERAEKIRSEISGEAEKGGMEYVARIRSTAATNKRNLLLQTKSDLIDADVITKGGLFKSAKVSYQSEKETFVKIDYRRVLK